MTRRKALTASASLAIAAGAGIALLPRRWNGDEDEISLEALLAEAPAPAMVSVSVPEGAQRLESFAGQDFDRDRHDASKAIERAVRWSSHTGRAVLIEGRWLLRHPAVLSHAGATLIFANAELQVRDDGRWITTKFPDTLPFAFYVTADRISLLGHCILTGLGQPGRSFLQGVYFEQVRAPTVGRFTVRNMAVGLHFMCCDEVTCGFVDAYSMWGLQGSPEEPNGAGSVQVVSGCRDSRFSGIRSLRHDKSARYLAVGMTADGLPRDNSGNEFGPAEVRGRPGSLWAHATGVRSSVGSRFVGGSGHDVSYLVVIQKYETDDAYHIDGNDFGDWVGTVTDPPASSVDAALNIYAAPGVATQVGRNRFGRIDASMAPVVPNPIQRLGLRMPATFGIYANSGETTVEAVAFTGFTHHIHLEDAALKITTLKSRQMARQPIRYGRGADLQIGDYLVLSDTVGPGRDRSLIGFVDAGSGRAPRVTIGRIDVRGAMPAEDTELVVGDGGAPGTIRIGAVLGHMERGGVDLSATGTPRRR